MQGRRNELFSSEARKFPLSYIQDAKNFSVVKPLNSGEARASRASPVPPPLFLLFNIEGHFFCLIQRDTCLFNTERHIDGQKDTMEKVVF